MAEDKIVVNLTLEDTKVADKIDDVAKTLDQLNVVTAEAVALVPDLQKQFSKIGATADEQTKALEAVGDAQLEYGGTVAKATKIMAEMAVETQDATKAVEHYGKAMQLAKVFSLRAENAASLVADAHRGNASALQLFGKAGQDAAASITKMSDVQERSTAIFAFMKDNIKGVGTESKQFKNGLDELNDIVAKTNLKFTSMGLRGKILKGALIGTAAAVAGLVAKLAQVTFKSILDGVKKYIKSSRELSKAQKELTDAIETAKLEMGEQITRGLGLVNIMERLTEAVKDNSETWSSTLGFVSAYVTEMWDWAAAAKDVAANMKRIDIPDELFQLIKDGFFGGGGVAKKDLATNIRSKLETTDGISNDDLNRANIQQNTLRELADAAKNTNKILLNGVEFKVKRRSEGPKELSQMNDETRFNLLESSNSRFELEAANKPKGRKSGGSKAKTVDPLIAMIKAREAAILKRAKARTKAEAEHEKVATKAAEALDRFYLEAKKLNEIWDNREYTALVKATDGTISKGEALRAQATPDATNAFYDRHQTTPELTLEVHENLRKINEELRETDYNQRQAANSAEMWAGVIDVVTTSALNAGFAFAEMAGQMVAAYATGGLAGQGFAEQTRQIASGLFAEMGQGFKALGVGMLAAGSGNPWGLFAAAAGLAVVSGAMGFSRKQSASSGGSSAGSTLNKIAARVAKREDTRQASTINVSFGDEMRSMIVRNVQDAQNRGILRLNGFRNASV